MAPSISLSYSSSTFDGVLGDVQAPWVGSGWNIDGIEIVRKITTSGGAYGYENKFVLTLNGSLYELMQDETHPSRYYVWQDGFLYIERHNYPLRKRQWSNKHDGGMVGGRHHGRNALSIGVEHKL